MTVTPEQPGKMLRAALNYAAYGWRVFPLRPRDKTPLTANGLDDADDAPEVLRAWWKQWPSANIGIATGLNSERRPFLVLDVDTAHGGTLAAVEALCGGHVPPTRRVATGGGGWHLYFLWPTDATRGGEDDVRNSAGKLAPGVDLRGTGGYVVAPPSVHPSGGIYAWHDRSDLLTVPEALLRAIRTAAPTPAYKDAASGEVAEVFPEGQRNNGLFSLGCALRAKGHVQSEIAAAIAAANQVRCVPPLPDDDIEKLVASVMRYAPGRFAPSAWIAEAQRREGERARERSQGKTLHQQATSEIARSEILVPSACEDLLLGIVLNELTADYDYKRDTVQIVASLLEVEDLAGYEHRQVLATVFDLEADGKLLRVPLLAQQLETEAAVPPTTGTWLAQMLAWQTAATSADEPLVLGLCETIQQAAVRRRMRDLGERLSLGASMTGPDTDPQDLMAYTEQVLRDLQTQYTPVDDSPSAHLGEYRDLLARWWLSRGRLTGVSYGVHALDYQTNGAQPGDLIVLGARSSVGKTAFATTMAAREAERSADTLAEDGRPWAVGVFSLEMSRKMIYHRLTSMLSGYSMPDLMRGSQRVGDADFPLDERHVEATLQRIGRLPLLVADQSTAPSRRRVQGNRPRGIFTPEEIRRRVRIWSRDHALRLLVVDFLELVSPSLDRRRDSRPEQLGDAALQLKRLAMDFNLPVVLLTQLNRESERRANKMPSMADIKYSDEVLNYCDVLLLLYRQDYYTERGEGLDMTDLREQPEGVVDVVLKKNRNGPTGKTQAYLHKKTATYYDWDAERQVPTDYERRPLQLLDGNILHAGSMPSTTSSSTDLASYRSARQWVAAPLPYADDTDDDTDD